MPGTVLGAEKALYTEQLLSSLNATRGESQTTSYVWVGQVLVNAIQKVKASKRDMEDAEYFSIRVRQSGMKAVREPAPPVDKYCRSRGRSKEQVWLKPSEKGWPVGDGLVMNL